MPQGLPLSLQQPALCPLHESQGVNQNIASLQHGLPGYADTGACRKLTWQRVREGASNAADGACCHHHRPGQGGSPDPIAQPSRADIGRQVAQVHLCEGIS